MQEVFFKNITVGLILEVLGLIIISVVILFLVSYIINKVAGKLTGKHKYNVLTLIPIIRILIVVPLVIYIFTLFVNITSTNLLALLGASGFIIGFALQDYASSIFAGIVSLYEMQYRPGDWVEINGVYGEVISSGLRSILILTPDDTVVHIPQQILWKTPFHNSNSGARELMCVVNFYLQPKHNGEIASKLLYDVALTSPLLQLKKPINVVVEEKPFYTEYRLKAYPIEAKDQFKFKSDLSIRGKSSLIEQGFEFQTFNPEGYKYKNNSKLKRVK